MPFPIERFKILLDYFGITQQQLANKLNVNASQISRWLSGKRRLSATNAYLPKIVDIFLSHAKRLQDINWLKAQLDEAGLVTDTTSVESLRQGLIIWLSSDGDALRQNLRSVSLSAKNISQKPQPFVAATGNATQCGALPLSLTLQPILTTLSSKSAVNIFLSSDVITTIVDNDISNLLIEVAVQNNLQIRLVICVSGDTRAMSRLIAAYLSALVSGHVQLAVVHGMTQTVTHQLHLIVPEHCAVLVTETPGGTASPVAVLVEDAAFVQEMQQSFDKTARYAKPILNIYGDDYSRNILEILYLEFCTPGALDVVKDSVNPMYMTHEGYNRVLVQCGHSAEEYEWRSAEFVRFKSGLDETLHSGAVFREILSLARLNDIVKTGFCRMSGLYFMQGGYLHLDAEGCANILNGYIQYLETVPNFHLLIVDDLDALHESNCWQLKQNQHLAVNCWSGSEPTMVYSDQLMLLREFQYHFDAVWEQGQAAIGNRANVIRILRDVAKQLQK